MSILIDIYLVKTGADRVVEHVAVELEHQTAKLWQGDLVVVVFIRSVKQFLDVIKSVFDLLHVVSIAAIE